MLQQRSKHPRKIVITPKASTSLFSIPSFAEESKALKRRLKTLSTAVHLDSGAALSLVHEALGMLVPILQLVALGDAASLD